jgi:glycine hydroxymethyltransferase
VNFSGRLYDAAQYGVGADGRLDFDHVRDQAHKHRPKVIVCGASAYPREIDFATFREIADEVGAAVVADIAHVAGLVAAGLHADPVPHCDLVTTTTHKTLRGPRGGLILSPRRLIKRVNSAVFPRMQGGPLMHVIAAKAVALGEVLEPSWKAYAQQIIDNTAALAETLVSAGIELVSGGTDNHLVLVSLLKSETTGKQAEEALGRAHITVNKNTVPGERRSPFVTSGLRIGTPALTTRGMKTDDLRTIAGWIVEILEDPTDEARQDRIREGVEELCTRFPIYPERLRAARAALVEMPSPVA